MILIASDTDIGTVLADMRLLARMNRRQVADACGIAPQQYGQYETGKRVPRLDALSRIFDAMGYDLALIPREDTP